MQFRWNRLEMNIGAIISRRLRRALEGIDAAGDVNAVVSANVGQPGSATAVSSTQRVVRRSRADAAADTTESEGGSDDKRARRA